jgi:hypothetical protein
MLFTPVHFSHALACVTMLASAVHSTEQIAN